MNPSDHTGSSVYSGAVPRPSCWPFYIQDIAQLRAETERLGLALPLSEESKPLWKELVLKSRRIPNRWCAQPVAGNDALPGGAPSPLTLRRYTRCAAGGFGLIWVERVVVNPRARSRPGGGLAITRRNLGAFADFTRAVRRAARDSRFRAPVLILQLAHAGGRAFSDRDLVKARGQIIAAADFAARAGFDGVDIQCCGNSLPAKMLAAFERPGKYGGPFENRARFLRELVRGVRAKRPELLIAVRLNAYAACACPPGFGVAGGNYREPDLREPGKLAKFLREDGAALLNITANSPNLRAAPAERARLPFADCDIGDEHPLAILSRNLAIAGALRAAAPGLPVVIGGWTWLRQFIPAAAAGALRAGNADFIGLGRAALA
jgi:2,4-dienoyl-CoA reductase-like NADH-dependent reductase (Old Yellow Enzyme family)